MAKRWDTDEVHHGVAGGRQAIPEVDRLRAALALPDWIAEDPEVHLLPSLQAAAADLGRSVRATSVGPGLLSVTVSVPARSARQIRAAALTMIGSIVEHATFVRERGAEDALVFDVATGVLEGDTAFAAHGHLLSLVFAVSVE